MNTLTEQLTRFAGLRTYTDAQIRALLDDAVMFGAALPAIYSQRVQEQPDTTLRGLIQAYTDKTLGSVTR